MKSKKTVDVHVDYDASRWGRYKSRTGSTQIASPGRINSDYLVLSGIKSDWSEISIKI